MFSCPPSPLLHPPPRQSLLTSNREGCSEGNAGLRGASACTLRGAAALDGDASVAPVTRRWLTSSPLARFAPGCALFCGHGASIPVTVFKRIKIDFYGKMKKQIKSEHLTLASLGRFIGRSLCKSAAGPMISPPLLSDWEEI